MGDCKAEYGWGMGRYEVEADRAGWGRRRRVDRVHELGHSSHLLLFVLLLPFFSIFLLFFFTFVWVVAPDPYVK